MEVAKNVNAVEEIGGIISKEKTRGASTFVTSPKLKLEASTSNDAGNHINDILETDLSGEHSERAGIAR